MYIKEISERDSILYMLYLLLKENLITEYEYKKAKEKTLSLYK
jgi:hypothetical protein